MPYASKVEQRLNIYLEYHPHVRTYQRGDVSKAFAEVYNLATPLETPYPIKYVYDGTRHEYLPDYIGTLIDGELLIAEAGLEDEKSTGKPLAKAEAARNIVKDRGGVYCTCTVVVSLLRLITKSRRYSSPTGRGVNSAR